MRRYDVIHAAFHTPRADVVLDPAFGASGPVDDGRTIWDAGHVERHSDESEALAAVANSADRIVVVAGSSYDARNRKANDVIGRAVGPTAVEDLLDALRTGPGERMDWMTMGNPALAFLDGKTLLAVVQCLPPDYIRCPELWGGDAPLRNPQALARWMTLHSDPEQGVPIGRR